MTKKTNQMFWGFFFILCAAFLICSKLLAISSISVFSLLFAVMFTVILLKSLARLEFPGVFFSLAFLCIIFSKPLHIESITPWPVLAAAILLSIGFSMIFKKDQSLFHIHTGSSEFNAEKSAVFNEPDGSTIRFDTTLGSSIKYVNSENFQAGYFDCSFASMKVYLDKAVIPSGHATVTLDVSFGNIDLYIPKEWTLLNHTDTSFGSVVEKNTATRDSNVTITLLGDVSFSGVNIIYV